jgi:hypothetical protein
MGKEYVDGIRRMTGDEIKERQTYPNPIRE